MRKTLVLAVLLLFVCGSAYAGIPDPSRSGCEFSGTGTATCHYAFSVDAATGDNLTIDVTLRDAFDSPVASCSTSAYLQANGSTAALCACEGIILTGFTNGSGVIQFVWNCIGGSGNLDVAVTAHCTGNIEICDNNIEFTSTDFDASCEGASSTGVVDLGAWVACYPPSPYCTYSDYDCDGTVGVVDLGFWASGYGKGCNDCP